MKPRNPISRLPTHEVDNMPPHLGDQHLWKDDQVLRQWLEVLSGKRVVGKIPELLQYISSRHITSQRQEYTQFGCQEEYDAGFRSLIASRIQHKKDVADLLVKTPSQAQKMRRDWCDLLSQMGSDFG